MDILLNDKTMYKKHPSQFRRRKLKKKRMKMKKLTSCPKMASLYPKEILLTMENLKEQSTEILMECGDQSKHK